jgi:hypothetical protein
MITKYTQEHLAHVLAITTESWNCDSRFITQEELEQECANLSAADAKEIFLRDLGDSDSNLEFILSKLGTGSSDDLDYPSKNMYDPYGQD